MNPERRLRELIGYRVKVRGAISRYQTKINALRKEQQLYLDKLDKVQKAITVEKRKTRVLWWWPWGE